MDEKNITVAVRTRPVAENSSDESILTTTEDIVRIRNPRDRLETTFSFDHVFPDTASQDDVFDLVGARVLGALRDGRNATIIAYGQTGSGKTFTMLGESGLGQAGLLARLGKAFLSGSTDPQQRLSRLLNMSVSFLEVYNDDVFDLLAPAVDAAPQKGANRKPKGLAVRMDADGGIVVSGMSRTPVNSEDDLAILLQKALGARRVASTAQNARSSRSHALFEFHLQFLGHDAKLVLADLAGSERVGSTGASGDRFKEGVSINRSLHALGNVISALAGVDAHTSAAPGSPSAHAPLSPSSSLSPRNSRSPGGGGNAAANSRGRSHSLPMSAGSPGSPRSPRTLLGVSHAASRSSDHSRPPPLPEGAEDFDDSDTDSIRSGVDSPSSARAPVTSRSAPFRQSKLTRLLQDSMTGESCIVMIATVHPGASNYWTSVSTLAYAARASKIPPLTRRSKVGGRGATSLPPSEELLRALRDEISRLQAELTAYRDREGRQPLSVTTPPQAPLPDVTTAPPDPSHNQSDGDPNSTANSRWKQIESTCASLESRILADCSAFSTELKGLGDHEPPATPTSYAAINGHSEAPVAPSGEGLLDPSLPLQPLTLTDPPGQPFSSADGSPLPGPSPQRSSSPSPLARRPSPRSMETLTHVPVPSSGSTPRPSLLNEDALPESPSRLLQPGWVSRTSPVNLPPACAGSSAFSPPPGPLDVDVLPTESSFMSVAAAIEREAGLSWTPQSLAVLALAARSLLRPPAPMGAVGDEPHLRDVIDALCTTLPEGPELFAGLRDACGCLSTSTFAAFDRLVTCDLAGEAASQHAEVQTNPRPMTHDKPTQGSPSPTSLESATQTLVRSLGGNVDVGVGCAVEMRVCASQWERVWFLKDAESQISPSLPATKPATCQSDNVVTTERSVSCVVTQSDSGSQATHRKPSVQEVGVACVAACTSSTASQAGRVETVEQGVLCGAADQATSSSQWCRDDAAEQMYASADTQTLSATQRDSCVSPGLPPSASPPPASTLTLDGAVENVSNTVASDGQNLRRDEVEPNSKGGGVVGAEASIVGQANHIDGEGDSGMSEAEGSEKENDESPADRLRRKLGHVGSALRVGLGWSSQHSRSDASPSSPNELDAAKVEARLRRVYPSVLHCGHQMRDVCEKMSAARWRRRSRLWEDVMQSLQPHASHILRRTRCLALRDARMSMAPVVADFQGHQRKIRESEVSVRAAYSAVEPLRMELFKIQAELSRLGAEVSTDERRRRAGLDALPDARTRHVRYTQAKKDAARWQAEFSRAQERAESAADRLQCARVKCFAAARALLASWIEICAAVDGYASLASLTTTPSVRRVVCVLRQVGTRPKVPTSEVSTPHESDFLSETRSDAPSVAYSELSQARMLPTFDAGLGTPNNERDLHLYDDFDDDAGGLVVRPPGPVKRVLRKGVSGRGVDAADGSDDDDGGGNRSDGSGIVTVHPAGARASKQRRGSLARSKSNGHVRSKAASVVSASSHASSDMDEGYSTDDDPGAEPSAETLLRVVTRMVTTLVKEMKESDAAAAAAGGAQSSSEDEDGSFLTRWTRGQSAGEKPKKRRPSHSSLSSPRHPRPSSTPSTPVRGPSGQVPTSRNPRGSAPLTPGTRRDRDGMRPEVNDNDGSSDSSSPGFLAMLSSTFKAFSGGGGAPAEDAANDSGSEGEGRLNVCAGDAIDDEVVASAPEEEVVRYLLEQEHAVCAQLSSTLCHVIEHALTSAFGVSPTAMAGSQSSVVLFTGAPLFDALGLNVLYSADGVVAPGEVGCPCGGGCRQVTIMLRRHLEAKFDWDIYLQNCHQLQAEDKHDPSTAEDGPPGDDLPFIDQRHDSRTDRAAVPGSHTHTPTKTLYPQPGSHTSDSSLPSDLLAPRDSRGAGLTQPLSPSLSYSRSRTHEHTYIEGSPSSLDVIDDTGG